MTILGSNQPYSTELGVLPHIHEAHHENFFGNKGQFALWTDKDNSSEARIFTPGDYGSVPTNTTHTYQALDPDAEIGGVIVPGGFEKLFFFLANANATYPTQAQFDPVYVADAAGGGSSASLISELESFDVYAQFDFVPRRDLVNGSAPSGSIWHDGNNTIPTAAGEPYYIASNWGPKYINGSSGAWQIIQPFVTPVTGEGQFTQGSITISRHTANVTLPVYNLANHTAFQVIEGRINVRIQEESASLIQGDVVFIPGGYPFSYWSSASFTKVMYVNAGAEGLDQVLLKDAQPWDYATFPVYYP